MSEPALSAAPVHAAVALGGLAAAGAALAQATGGNVLLVLPGILAVVAVVRRSLALTPVIVILMGVLLLGPGTAARPVRDPLRANDLILVAGSLAFLAGLSGLARRDADPNPRLSRTGRTVIAAVLLGQAAVAVASRYNFDWPARGFLVTAPANRVGDLTGRAIVALALMTLSVAVAGFILWYARHANQTRDQARATLLDTAWAESRRELSRQALFRARLRAPRLQLRWRNVLSVALLAALLMVLAGVVVVRFFPD